MVVMDHSRPSDVNKDFYFTVPVNDDERDQIWESKIPLDIFWH